MDKNQFFSADPHSRVKKINKLLESKSLEEVAELIGLPRSTFSKEMQKEDYVFIKRDNQFYHFLRDGKSALKSQESHEHDIIKFIEDHRDNFNALFQNMNGQRVDINPEIYDDSTKIITKSIRIREKVYKKFQAFCQENWPQFNVQDLLAQALLEFIEKKTMK